VASVNLRLSVRALIILRIRDVDNRKLASIAWIDIGSEILDEFIDVGAFVRLVQIIAETYLVLPSGLRFVALRTIQSTQAIRCREGDIAVRVDLKNFG
jgi:hypothetical protein